MVSGAPPKDPHQVLPYLWAHALMNALDARPVSRAVLDLLKSRADAHTAALYAGLIRDEAWPPVAAALGAFRWLDACGR